MGEKNISTLKLSREEENILIQKAKLNKRLTEGYVHKSGIKVRATFKEKGDNITECWSRILKEKLRE